MKVKKDEIEILHDEQKCLQNPLKSADEGREILKNYLREINREILQKLKEV